MEDKASFDEYLATSARAKSQEAVERRAVFAHSYSAATQLIELRQKRGLTQKRLATLTGIAQSEISRIERGVIHPTEVTLTKLADALDADLRIIERPPLTNLVTTSFQGDASMALGESGT